MQPSLLSLSLLILLSTPHTTAAPTNSRRQYGPGGRFGPNGSGRPGPGSGAGRPGGGRPPSWTPPWVSPASDNSVPESGSEAAQPVPTTAEDTLATILPTVAVPETSNEPILTSSIIVIPSISPATTAVVPSTLDFLSQQTTGSSSALTTSLVAQSTVPAQFFPSNTTSLLAASSSIGIASVPSTSSTTFGTSFTTNTAALSTITSISSSPSFLGSVVQSSTTTIPSGTSTSLSSSQLSAPSSSLASTSTSTSVSTVSSALDANGTPYMLNGTFPSNSPPTSPQPSSGLTISLVNTFATTSTISIYITAMDASGRVMFLSPQQTWFYPTSSSSTIPQPIDSSLITNTLGSPGSTTNLNLPGYFSSGRVYFSQGPLSFFTLLNPTSGVTIVAPNPLNPSDSSYNTDWSFLEMTYTAASGLFANLSFVDFLSRLPLGMQLTLSSGSVQTVQGTSTSSVDTVCAALTAQAAKDGQPWDKLCQKGTSSSSQVLRANSPAKYIAAVDQSAFRTYWDSYITAVWAKYATEDLLIDTQSDAGVVRCSTASGNLLCPGSSRPLPAPLSTSSFFANPALDIFGCSGIFTSLPSDNSLTLALLPRICAALNRATLLANTQTPTSTTTYYQGDGVMNWYSKVVHEVEKDGRGYAFAYDDVSASTGGQGDVSGTVAGSDIAGWKVWVGGMAS